MSEPTPSSAAAERRDRPLDEPLSLGGAGGPRSSVELTPAQRALWASQRLHPSAPLQNMALVAHIDGPVDADRLSSAFGEVVRSSRTLRLTIGAGDKVAIAVDPPRKTLVIDLPRSAVASWAQQRVQQPIDVAEAVYDSVVIRHDDGTASWYLCLHHVATDATSSALVFEATEQMYHGRPIQITDLDPSPLPDSKRRSRATRFWADRAQAPVVDSLYRPIEHRSTRATRRPIAGLDMAAIERVLDGPYRMISRDLAWTSLLMTVVAVHLHRTSGAERFAVGLPVHNRSGRGSERVIGPLMEVYPVDVSIDSAATFASVHAAVSKQLMTVVGHALPAVGATASDVSAIVNVIPRGSFGTFGGSTTSTMWIHPGAADPTHLLGVQLTTYESGELAVALDVNAAAATESQQRSATHHFRTLLHAMVADPNAAIHQPDLLDEAERRVTEEWGSGAALDPSRFTLDPRRPRSTGLVVDRLSVSLSNSAKIAITDGKESLTGKQLWAKAGLVAANLVEAGIGRGDRVGIEMSRSIDAVTAILGVLRAGASYVPIDPNHPESRRLAMSERAQVSGVLTDLSGVTEGVTLPDVVIEPDAEAYTLFTSGSSGEPKGVPITHGGLADYLGFACENYLGPKQRRPVAPLFTSLGFDLTVTSLFVPLIAGGTVVVIGEDGVPGLRAVAGRSDLTWIKATPSHLELLGRMLPASHRISTMIVGGEAFASRLALELSSNHPGLEIFNEYGPTEAVVGCMIHRFDPLAAGGSDVPIGQPVPGVDLRIVGPGGHDVPPGVAGELIISSDRLSPGYLGQPLDTPPFDNDGARRSYASGDLVRLAEDGDAIFLGRVDDQIKLNGVRMEPAEVVAALEQHAGVARAVVRLWQPSTDARPVLAAWLEAADGQPLELGTIRSFLVSRLATHQVPVAYRIVDELPFNNNGKLDVASLPSPERVRGGGDGRHALDQPAAEAVRAAWRKALRLSAADPAIGPADDFFVLGGDSLAALEMTAALSDGLDIEVSESLVFTAPGFADFVSAVGELDPGEKPAAGPVAGASTELSPGERAMLFEHRLDPESPRYNIGRRYVVNASVDPERLRSAAERVVARHAPLHTTYAAPRAVLDPSAALHFSVPSSDPLTDEISRVAADALYRAPFDLSEGPLVRVALHPLLGDDSAPDRSAVVVVSHHVSGDAGSLDRFWSDLDAAYSGEELAPLTVSYADHAHWQAQRDTGGDFWAQQWAESVETGLGLPGAAGEHTGGYAERRATFTASALRAGAGRTPTATALAALATLLDRHHHPSSGDRPARYAIGLTASVREHAVSDPMVGYFLNTLPLVVDVEAAPSSVAELAQHTSDVLASALPHRAHPFAEMVARARREKRQLPIPEVLLAVEDLAPAALDGQVAEHEVIASGEAIAPATVFIQLRGERVDLGIEYAGSVLNRERALLMLDDLDALISSALSTPTDELPTIPSEGRAMLSGLATPDDRSLLPSIVEHTRQRGTLAAVCGDEGLTWPELGRRSARLAERLRLNGVGVGDRVVVSLPRSVDLVVALLATHRVGAVYVPLDPSYPEARRQTILDVASPTAAVVRSGDEYDWLTCVSVPGPSDDDIAFVDHAPDVQDPAYIIFTSGSTGAPKGVEVTHGRLATSTRARDGVYDGRPDRFLLLSSIGFDSSIVGLFWTLLAGGTVVIPSDAEAHDPDALLDVMDRSAVSHVLMVPSLYRALLTRGSGAPHWPSVVIVAGEACSPELVAEHHERRPDSELWNEYGPTEGTVWTTAHRCVPAESPVPIGRPIPGSWCAVVDSTLAPVPAGSSGELLIGGAGVVDGYVTGPTLSSGEQTQAPFIDSSTWGRAYRTGDAAAIGIDESGAPILQFRGRVDDQLNVGGVRLEPGEVENVLVAVDGIDAAAVVASAIGSSGRPVLVAHIQSSGVGGDFDVAALREAVNSALPAAARPSRYVSHDRLPTTAHGKIDRALLTTMALEDGPESTLTTSDSAVDVLSDIERVVLEVFQRNVQGDVGIDDGFFDAGGDSLGALSLAIELEERFDTSFSVTTLLAEPTARAVARRFSPEHGAASDVDRRFGADEIDRRSTSAPSLVEWIREGEPGRTVLVLLAPGSGHLVGYEPLIRALDPTTPLLGVRLPGYDGKTDPVSSVPKLADLLAPLIDAALGRRHDSADSRAVLFGGSSGGLLAWELQVRAETAGRPFAAIIAQDTVHPEWRREQAAIGVVEQLKEHFDSGGPSAVVSELYGRAERKFARWQRARRSQAQAAETGAENPAVIAQRMFAATTAGLLAYRAPKIDGPVLFLAASNTDPDATFERWKTLCSRVRVEVFDGDHFGENGITAARNVQPVAATIEEMMAELDRSG